MSDTTTTTTAAPAASPPTPTTQAPAAATTEAPAANTTQAPAATNTTQAPAGNTPAAPGGSTTASPNPGTTTTAPAAGAGPSVTGKIEIDPDDGSPQNPNSVQVPEDAKLTLTWSSNNAASVNIDGIGDGQAASGSQSVATKEATFTLVAVADDGSKSPSFVIAVATHPAGTVASGHSEISSGVAVVVSFNAVKDGQSVTHAVVGDEITLTAIVSESTDSVTINGSPADVTETSDGHKQATAAVTIADGMTGDFSCEVSANGTAGDPGSVHLDIGAAATVSTTTTVAPGFTTTQPSASTTQAVAATTTLAVSPATTTTLAPAVSTTQPVQTTTAQPAGTTTHPPATTTKEEGKSTFLFPGEAQIGVEFPILESPRPLGKYFMLNSIAVALSFKGSFESEAGPVAIQPTWGASWGVAVKSGGTFNWGFSRLAGDWTLTEFEVTSSPPEVKFGAEAKLNYKFSETVSAGMIGSVEVVAIGLKKSAKGEWEGEIGELVGKLGGDMACEIKTEDPKGSWKGTAAVTFVVKLGPNWMAIIGDAGKKILEKVGEAAADLLSEAAVDLIAGIAEMAIPFAVAGVIIYAFWAQSEDMAASRDLISGSTTDKAVDKFKEGFAAGLNQGQPSENEGVVKEGFTHGQAIWTSTYAKYKATKGVQDWTQQVKTTNPDYGNDPSWVEDQIKDAFQKSLSPKVDAIAAKAAEQARPEIKHQLFLAWAAKHNNNTVDCLPVLVNLYPRRSDFTWAPGALPADLAAMATKYGWVDSSAIKKKAAAPPTNTTKSPLGQKLEDHATAKGNLLAWAKNNVMVHADSYRTMYRHSADLALLTDEDLRDVDAQVHPDLLGGN